MCSRKGIENMESVLGPHVAVQLDDKGLILQTVGPFRSRNLAEAWVERAYPDSGSWQVSYMSEPAVDKQDYERASEIARNKAIAVGLSIPDNLC